MGEPETYHAENGKREAVSVLFGAQGEVTSKSLLELRTTLQDNVDLNFLSTTVAELPLSWPIILEVWPDLDIVPARKRLNELCQFFQGGSAETFPLPTENILLCPLTVITQIVDFWKLTHGVDTPPLSAPQLRDIQGFCLGFLTAIAVSCSKDEKQFQNLASKMVRLAVCMGALADLDALGASGNADCALTFAVRWRSDEQLKHLQHTMKLYPGVSMTSPIHSWSIS